MIDIASIAFGRRHDEPQDNKQTREQKTKQASKQTRKKVIGQK